MESHGGGRDLWGVCSDGHRVNTAETWSNSTTRSDFTIFKQACDDLDSNQPGSYVESSIAAISGFGDLIPYSVLLLQHHQRLHTDHGGI